MASGQGLPLMTGTYIGDGTGFAINTPGYRPKAVIICNMTTASVAIHTDKMDDAQAFSVVAASAVVGANGVTFDDDGFTVGSDNTVCKDGDQFQWICLG